MPVATFLTTTCGSRARAPTRRARSPAPSDVPSAALCSALCEYLETVFLVDPHPRTARHRRRRRCAAGCLRAARLYLAEWSRLRTGVERQAHIVRIRGQEQVGAEGLYVLERTFPAGESRARDSEPVMSGRVEDAKPGIGDVPRKSGPPPPACARLEQVQRQQLLDQRERHAQREHVVLMLDGSGNRPRRRAR